MTENKALLLITTSFPRSVTGSEAAGSFVVDLAEELSAHIRVNVVAPGPDNSVQQRTPTLSVYRFKSPEGALANLRLWHPTDVWRVLCVLRSGMNATRRAAREVRIKHTLALWALPSGYWARQLRREAGVPYSVWMLGSDIWTLGRIPVIRGVLRKVIADARFRFADGLLLADDSRRIAGCEVAFLPTTRRLNATGIDAPAARPPYRLIFLGRWHPNKGIDLLLDALALLHDSDWEKVAEVRIYGGGPLEETVRANVQSLVDAQRPVAVGGFLGKTEAEAAIARADYLVLPSRIESIPVVFSDAMKLNRPVIATPVGDLPALFAQAGFGVLASEVSAVSIASAIRAALGRSPADFNSALREHASQFDIEAITGALLRKVTGSV